MRRFTLSTLTAGLLGLGVLNLAAPANAQVDPAPAQDAAAEDDQFDLGWIGLAGLVGLLGLMRRDRHNHREHHTTTTTGRGTPT